MGELPAVALGATFVAMLGAVTVTDLREGVIPNRLLLGGAAVGVAVASAGPASELVERIAAAGAAAGTLLVPALVRPEGMGLGDVKLAGVMGLFLGRAVAPALIIALALGAMVGAAIVLRHGLPARRRGLPFAPFLAAGGIVGLAAGDRLVDGYLNLLRA